MLKIKSNQFRDSLELTSP
uniref:Uncharacterized protein n=1 Tax=Rhizophora mucronata TaxID=61149 RepID=A0A2P2PU50_RHIMU